MSKVAVDRHQAPTRTNKHQQNQFQQQESSSLVSTSANPMLQMASSAGNQAVIQMMRGTASEKGKSSVGSSGERLPENVREKMEQSFQTDFSNVQIHKDSNTASSLGAQAFAQGEQLHFSPGQFSPDSREGQKLLGHELAHVVQQREGQVDQPQGKGFAVNIDQGLEQKADAAGERAANGLSAYSRTSRADASISSSMAESSHAGGAPIQASFFKSILGGIKKAGQGFMEGGGLQTLLGAGQSAGQALLGGGSFGDALKAGGNSFMQGGGLGQLGGAALGGVSSFATDSGLADKASPYLEQAQPFFQKFVDSGATDAIGGKVSGFGSSMEGGGGLKGLFGKGLGLAGNFLGGLNKKKR